MSGWEGFGAGQVAYLVAVVVVSVTLGVVGLVAIAAAEARSRRGEAERVVAIRRRLVKDRQLAGRGVRGRS